MDFHSAVAETKDACRHMFHEIRYQFDYMKMDYRQKYYSNRKNPRVIHTKLQNQKLLTLRTFPRDKYFTKAGEFLKLDESYEDKDWDKDEDEYDESALISEYGSGDVISSTPSIEETPKGYAEFLLEKLGIGLNENTDPDHAKANDLKKLVINLCCPRLSRDHDNKEFAMKCENSSPPSPPRKDSLGGILADQQGGVWKSVLNDISLSAARISTGLSSNGAKEFSRLSSDFVDAKFKSDVFAANLEQAKAMYHDDSYNQSILSMYLHD